MRAYLLYQPKGKLYMAFGEDCMSAAESLGKQIGVDPNEFSVGGSWDVDPEKPIEISKLWPYFTCWPPERYTE